VIVELIGCAGAGKTTLRRMLCERSVSRQPVVAMSDLVIPRGARQRITNPTVVNLAQEVMALPSFLRAWRREQEYLAFARELVTREGFPRYERVVAVRGLERKIGMYHLARRRARGKVVIWDEGALLSAYNLFVPGGYPLAAAEVERFAAQVPLPDRIVYVTAPVELLVARALSRPDRRRQHVGRDEAAVARNIGQTVELFDLLAETPPVAERTLIVANDGPASSISALADSVVSWLESEQERRVGVDAGRRVVTA
jgi:thymidylate kinase